MDTQTILILAGAIVVALILRSISTKKTGSPGLPPPQPSAIDANPVSTPSSTAPRNLQKEVEIRQLIASHKLIEAIKLVRQETNCGLREAKDYVDRLGA
jgi:ribosomal protein L7/L12